MTLIRRFFSGPSLTQAVLAAARHHAVDPEDLAYEVIDKKHGFLKTPRGVVIEVDPELPTGAATPATPEEDAPPAAADDAPEAAAPRDRLAEMTDPVTADSPVFEPLAPAAPAAEPYGFEPSTEEAPTAEAPAAPVSEPPVSEPPVSEPPVSEPPVSEPPVSEPPLSEAPMSEPPVAQSPGSEFPVAELPVSESPLAEFPLAEFPVAEPPAPELPAFETGAPAGASPADETPRPESPLGESWDGGREPLAPPTPLPQAGPPGAGAEPSESSELEAAGAGAGQPTAPEVEPPEAEEAPPADAGPADSPPAVLDDELRLAVAQAVDELVYLAGLRVQVASAMEVEDGLAVELEGPDNGRVVAHGGRALLAIQHLLPRLLFGKLGRAVHCRLDCDGFHAARAARLERLAQKAAERVRSGGRSWLLEPMAPDERRLVHLALADEPDVETESVGEGYLKRVRVARV